MEETVLVSPPVQEAFKRFELAALFRDADTPEALAAYQAAKREHKRQVRAQRERKD